MTANAARCAESPARPPTTIPLGTSWLLGDCMEARGKQDLWVRQKPEILAALKEQAIIQSAQSPTGLKA